MTPHQHENTPSINGALMNTCLNLVKSNMPYSESEHKMVAHHWVAKTGKWNEERRWDPMDLQAPCTIWYVGGNINGEDGVKLQKQYPCEIHVFEPVPPYFEALKTNYEKVPRSHVHGYGIGGSTRIVKNVKLEGQSTYAMEGGSSGGSEYVDLPIRSFTEVYADLGNNKVVDLIHINCEGCEWEMFESMIANNLVTKFRIIQFSAHYYFDNTPSAIETTERRYCEISTGFSQTHKTIFQIPFGWERFQFT